MKRCFPVSIQYEELRIKRLGQGHNNVPWIGFPKNMFKLMAKKIIQGFFQQFWDFFQQFWEKALGQNWEKKIDLTAKLGEINNIEHNKCSKIYSQNQVILESIMPTRGATIRQKAYCDMENLHCDTPVIFISVYYCP